MATRLQWTEWHLTPRGWERGSTRSQGKNNWVDDPEDRIISFVRKEDETAASAVAHSTEETWRSPSAHNVDELLQKHGKCPGTL